MALANPSNCPRTSETAAETAVRRSGRLRTPFSGARPTDGMEELLTGLVAEDDTEKGERGRVGVVAGCVGHAGPPALTGEAAIRTGSDLAKIVTSERVLTAVAGFSENLIVDRYTGDHLSEGSVSKVGELDAWSDVMVVGPGLSEPDPEAVRRIVDDASVPLVVDADAVEPALAAESFSRSVFTPDANEADKITDAYGSLEAFSKETGAVVVSTGSSDEIYAGDEYWTNDTGTPSMTVAGTGDTMAGIVASLIGQGLDRVDAARLGTWLVGTAGERATEEYGIGLMATDIIERIPRVMLDHAAVGPTGGD